MALFAFVGMPVIRRCGDGRNGIGFKEMKFEERDRKSTSSFVNPIGSPNSHSITSAADESPVTQSGFRP